MTTPKRRPKLNAETSATLDRLAERLKALPADRREAFERDVLKSARKAEGGGRTGRPPIHGESMTTPVLVRVTPAMRRDMEKAAETPPLSSPRTLRGEGRGGVADCGGVSYIIPEDNQPLSCKQVSPR